MDRCKDYFGFAIWFTGFGYIALWPLTGHGIGGIGFGAAWTLPPTLQAIGMLSAVFVVLRAAVAGVAPAARGAPRGGAAMRREVAAARLRPPRWKALRQARRR